MFTREKVIITRDEKELEMNESYHTPSKVVVKRITEEECEKFGVDRFREFTVVPYAQGKKLRKKFVFTVVVDITKESYKDVIRPYLQDGEIRKTDIEFFEILSEGRLINCVGFDLEFYYREKKNAIYFSNEEKFTLA